MFEIPFPPHFYLWGIAQYGSALVLGTRGRWFKSNYPDHLKVDIAILLMYNYNCFMMIYDDYVKRAVFTLIEMQYLKGN